MNSIYRRSMLLLFVFSFTLQCLACQSSAQAGTVQLAEERVTDAVWGTGKTGNQAKADAENQARQKSGGNYTVVKVEVKRVGEQYNYHLFFSYAKP